MFEPLEPLELDKFLRRHSRHSLCNPQRCLGCGHTSCSRHSYPLAKGQHGAVRQACSILFDGREEKHPKRRSGIGYRTRGHYSAISMMHLCNHCLSKDSTQGHSTALSQPHCIHRVGNWCVAELDEKSQ